MNIRYAAILAVAVISGAGLTALLPEEAPAPPSQSASPARIYVVAHDRIKDWSDDELKRGVVPGELGVVSALEIRVGDPTNPRQPVRREQYFAVGALGDMCMVTYRNFDAQGRTQVEISGRWEGVDFNYSDKSPWIGPKQAVRNWVWDREKYCVYQTV